MAANPCPPPNGRTFSATNGRNPYDITVTITHAAWLLVPADEQDMVIALLSSEPISVQAGLAAKGDCIKRESNGWSIHTQTNKSLYDMNISKGDAGKKTFKFDSYKKRPH